MNTRLRLKLEETTLSPEDIKLHRDRHEALNASLRHGGYPRSGNIDEVMWERTLGELSGGKYDSILGLRLFLAEVRTGHDKQRFLDEAATKLCRIIREGNGDSPAKAAAAAYDLAEALWAERRKRREVDAEIPF
jgi:hypothetical protein